MKINLKELSSQAVESTTTTKKMRLSENASSMVFQLFTKNVYSNPIGTVIREITSNCFDSHVEAGVDAPVLIKKSFDGQTDTHYISFIDFGVGMSPDRVENIYGVYFESTKRLDNTQIGGFGIGGKTPLAYKRSTGQGEGEYDNSFYVITIHNGIKYYYCIFEGAESPEWNLLHQENTKERNGTEIRIPVLERDMQKFESEMTRQLYYFENIIFEGFGESTDEELNKYQIVRGKNFLFRGTDYSSNIHVCLGRVAYPIDFNVLDLNAYDYQIPIALKLEVGEIGVTVSRESLDYSEQTIKILKKKIELAKTEMVQLLEKQYDNIVTLKDYFNMKTNFGYLNMSNGATISLRDLVKQKDVDLSNFKYSFTKMPNDKQLFRFFFDVKSYGKKPRRNRWSSNQDDFEGGYDEIQRRSNLLYVNDEFNRKVIKQSYLKSMYELYHIVSKNEMTSRHLRSDIADLFNVHLDELVTDKGKPVAFVKSLIEMQEEYFGIVREFAEDYDNLEIPENFVAERKRSAVTSEMKNTSIPVKFINRYSKSKVRLKELFEINVPIFYGTQDDEYKLSEADNLFKTLFDENCVITGYSDYNNSFSRNDKKKGIMFIMLSKNNIKYMEHCKKAYHVDTFNHKMLYRKEEKVLKYFQTYDVVEKYKTLDDLYKTEHFSIINSKWGKLIDNVRKDIQTIPTDNRRNSMGYLKDVLSKYFDLKKVTKDSFALVLESKIDKLIDLQKKNSNILGHINMPYRYDNLESQPELVSILQKVMVF